MPRPTERVVEILRRAAVDQIGVRTIRSSLTSDILATRFVYGDGAEIFAGGHPMTGRDIGRMVREGWLIPGDDVGLWRARTLADPAIEAKPRREGVGEQRPTLQQTAILRRISTHKLVVAFIDGRKGYSYGDGLPVRREDAERLIRNRWVTPESPGLFHGEEPQSYVCRQLR